MIWNLCLNFVVKIHLSGFEYVPRYNLEIRKNLQICISKIHKIDNFFLISKCWRKTGNSKQKGKWESNSSKSISDTTLIISVVEI